MVEEKGRDISIPANISLRQSQLEFIDKVRVKHDGYRSRSDYLQYLTDRDIRYRRFDSLIEIMSMEILPMLSFFFFLLLAVMTAGMLFYLFMCITGLFAVFLSFVYYIKHKPRKKRRNK